MHYVGISRYQFIPYYASAMYTSTHILKPFEDCETTGLNVDIAEVACEADFYFILLKKEDNLI